MDPNTPPDAGNTDADSDSESLLRYHLLGWGVFGLVLVGIVVAYVTVSPPGSGAYSWADRLGPRAEWRLFGLSFGLTILLVTVVGALVTVVASTVIGAVRFVWKNNW